jgi:hypothetical protein
MKPKLKNMFVNTSKESPNLGLKKGGTSFKLANATKFVLKSKELPSWLQGICNLRLQTIFYLENICFS